MSTGIYLIRNLVNDHIYIGSTSQSFEERKYQHFIDLKGNHHGNKHLQSAYNKYGEENFFFEILEYCNPELCLEIEQSYLDFIFDPNLFPEETVYNLSKYAGSPMKGLNHSQEVRDKISKIHSGKAHSKEWNEKVSRTKKGKKKNLKSIIKSAIGHQKAVLQFDKDMNLIMEYKSLTEASRITEISITSISYACRKYNNQKFAGNYRWEYKNGK